MTSNVIDLFAKKEVWIHSTPGSLTGRQIIRFTTKKDNFSESDILRSLVRLPHPDPKMFVFLASIRATGNFYLCSVNYSDLETFWLAKGFADNHAMAHAVQMVLMIFRSTIIEESVKVTASDELGRVAVAKSTISFPSLDSTEDIYVAHGSVGVSDRISLTESLGVTHELLIDIQAKQFKGLFTVATDGQKSAELIRDLEGYWTEPLVLGMLYQSMHEKE